MGKHVRHLYRGDGLTPTAASLLAQPLDFIHQDHLREREICTQIDRLAQAGSARIARVIHGFLTRELPLHIQDEEQDLFPLVRRRCTPEDQMDKVIARLHRDHDHAAIDTPKICALLRDVADTGRVPDEPEQRDLRSFAKQSRRHLILENAIILPFARLRLTDTDLLTLRIRMQQRRGIDPQTGHLDAE